MTILFNKKIHILGIGGTFMTGVALLAHEKGFQVSGSDNFIYPPMSDQLDKINNHIKNKNNIINIINHYNFEPLDLINPDQIIIGNALSRGKPVIEELLNRKLNYCSGPEWVYQNILKNNKKVIAVSGTHGKTTTTSLIAWILEYAGFNPGFLIGGIPENFGYSARLGGNEIFVIEADEYDTAFFDKRSKFIHYRPDILILNNLEFDHADIFPDLSAIKKQFEHLIRTVPQNGLIIANHHDKNIQEIISRGCWTPIIEFGQNNILIKNLTGEHNQFNANAAIQVANHLGINIQITLQALEKFKGVKRRLEIISQKKDLTIYDDFAHHPTAIQLTLEGLRKKIGLEKKIIAVLELASNTMKMGIHHQQLIPALASADEIIILKPNTDFNLNINNNNKIIHLFNTLNEIKDYLITQIKSTLSDKHIIFMSNTGFHGLPQKLLKLL